MAYRRFAKFLMSFQQFNAFREFQNLFESLNERQLSVQYKRRYATCTEKEN